MSHLKVIIIAVVAAVIAFFSADYLEPQSASLKMEYEKRLNFVKSKPPAEITEEERAELEAMFLQLNSAKNIEAEMKQIVLGHGLFFLLTLPLAFFSAHKLAMNNNNILAAGGLIGLVFIISGQVITGAILGATFVVTGLSKNQRALRAAAAAKSN